MNEVILDNGLVQVGGPFRLSDTKENRAVVAFDEGTVQLNDVFLLIVIGILKWIFRLW